MAERKQGRERILIIGPFGIGDVLFTTVVIAALRAKFPNACIVYLCNKKSNPVLAANPKIDEILNFTRGDFKNIRRRSKIGYIRKLFTAFSQLYRQKFDLIVDLSLVHQYSMFLKFMGNANIIGFNYHQRGFFLTKKINIDYYNKRHVIDYYADLLRLINLDVHDRMMQLYLPGDSDKWGNDFLKEHNLDGRDKIIAVFPGGGASWGKNATMKHWPAKFFAETLNQLKRKLNVKIIVMGSSTEMDICNALLKQMPLYCINLGGKTSIFEVAAIIKKVSLVLCNDGGPLHIAVALNVPTVSIFGPVDDAVYGPYPKSQTHKVLKADISCRPCYKNFKITLCHDMRCLTEIRPQQVISACEESLNENSLFRFK
ncbi:MAG: glycosyltransferase family 9 protein [Candidatus Omnitrophota bacterium]